MNTLFNKVLGENEKCVLFLLKTERIFWPAQYMYLNHFAVHLKLNTTL